MMQRTRKARNEQGNIVVFLLIVAVFAIVGLVSVWRWADRKIRENKEQSIPTEVFEAFVRFACPRETEKLLVVSPDTTHPAVGPACPAVYLTLAEGDAKPRPRCVRSQEQHVYGTALCAKREQVNVDAFTVTAFKAPPPPEHPPRPLKQ